MCLIDREFSEVDMKTTTLMLKIVKSVFPSFEFTWLVRIRFRLLCSSEG